MGDVDRHYTGEFPPDGSTPTVDDLVIALVQSVERVRIKYGTAISELANLTDSNPAAILAWIDATAGFPVTPAPEPEFWVAPDCDSEPAIWWWDGTTLTQLVHQHDVIYGSADGLAVQGRREARTRLWDHITHGIPTAPLCHHDGCNEVLLGSTDPDFCPTHTSAEENQ